MMEDDILIQLVKFSRSGGKMAHKDSLEKLDRLTKAASTNERLHRIVERATLLAVHGDISNSSYIQKALAHTWKADVLDVNQILAIDAYALSHAQQIVKLDVQRIYAISQPLISSQQIASFLENLNRVATLFAQAAIPVLQDINRLVILVAPVIQNFAIAWSGFKASILEQMLASIESSISKDAIDSLDVEVSELSTEDKSEIVEMTELIVTQPKNWQNVMMERIKKWSVDNPFLVWVFHKLIILIPIVMSTLALYVTNRDTPIRENPDSNAQIVTTVIEKQVVNIVNEVPYWFEVEFRNPNTGSIYNGWMSKRSIEQYEPSIQIREESEEETENEAGSIERHEE